ncbi:MAG TPA: DUF1499 domain-containing protein [Pseudolabrys sp.]|nr:DUF1499 domain-containing protein [Pseudolabrys sp.]
MARRIRLGEEPVSRLAAWSRRLALFALAVAALSILIVRSNLLEIEPALATFGAALVFAGLAVLVSFAAFVVIWRTGKSGLGAAMTGLILGLLLLAYPGYLGYRASKLPPISDISTDPDNPPRFDTLARLRPPDRVAYPGAATAEKQRAAYPDVAPLQVSAPVKYTFDVALALVTKRKWHVADARPPGPGRRDGVIEATARTPIMGFRDDVVIRVSPTSDGARVDMRSASRYGLYDFGANAARVRSLLEDIDDGIGTVPEQRPEPAKKPAPAPKRQQRR